MYAVFYVYQFMIHLLVILGRLVMCPRSCDNIWENLVLLYFRMRKTLFTDKEWCVSNTAQYIQAIVHSFYVLWGI